LAIVRKITTLFMLGALMTTLFKQEMPTLQKSKRRLFHLVNLFVCSFACVKDHMMNTKTTQENTKLVKKIKANKQFEQQTNIKQIQ
jgi:hypothetical protein